MASIDLEWAAAQRQFCEERGIAFAPPAEGSKVGVALNVRDGIVPVNGLRHPPQGDTNGWFIWAGEVLSPDGDFFKPLHVEHLPEWRPEIVKLLALPPGWRFLVAGEYVDVWFDESLLLT